ncbi:MAG: dipeptidase [Phycisphaeraceae bacterium]
MRSIIDAHLDLSWSALSWDRDLTLPLETLRERERHMTDDKARGNATITIDELRRARVAVCFGTLLARAIPAQGAARPELDLNTPMKQHAIPAEGNQRRALDFPNQQHAYAIAQGQLAYYRQLEREGYFRLIRTRADLDAHWQQWTAPDADPQQLPIGIIIAMEGADPIVTPEQAEAWYADGLRAVGPVHYGRSAYAVGTGFDGPLTDAGRELLKQFERIGMILDVTHLSDTSFDDVLDRFAGRVIASHHNCRALVDRQRQLTDDQIKRLVERDAVIGAAIDSWMLHPDFKVGESAGDLVTLDAVADHIDHVCQLAGNTRHSAIGSDLDGGYGTEQTPADLDTIADMQKLETILARRGYSDVDIDAIFHANWLRLLRETLPA